MNTSYPFYISMSFCSTRTVYENTVSVFLSNKDPFLMFSQ